MPLTRTSFLVLSRCLLCPALAAVLATAAHAAVTTVAWYRLGENDPGGVSGLTVTNTTADLVGANHLKQFNSPLYIHSVAASATSRLGSSLAVNFNGTSQYLSNAVVSTAINNFGLEAWVKPNATASGNRTIVYNGNPLVSGWGFIQRAGTEYKGSLGTMTAFGSGPAAAGVWAHLALVRDNGTTTFYVNGVASGTSISNPIPPALSFIVAAHPNLLANTWFDGAIDEVRVFTFAPGQFTTNDLLFNLQRVTTLAASGITPTNATLNGSVNTVGFPTSAWFEWGTATNYGNVTPLQPLGSTSTNVSQVLSNFGAGITYHFRAVASNSLGLVSGANQSFTMLIFSDIGAGLPGTLRGSAGWGDYDNDGRLDILLTGGLGSGVSPIWRNTGSGFANLPSALPTVTGDTRHGTMAWGDYDNDGWLDVLLAGIPNAGSGNAISQVWRNNSNGVFTNIQVDLPGVVSSSVAWGDYNNDGRLDIALAGYSPTSAAFLWQVWRNEGDAFLRIASGLPGFSDGSMKWGDYDNDGRLDLLYVGTFGGGSFNFGADLWRNNGSAFSNALVTLPGVTDGSVAWGDYDNDGWLDFLLTGFAYGTGISQLWRNTGGTFTNVPVAGLPGVYYSAVAWGDYDNDGRLDFLLTGTTNGEIAGAIAQIWRNTGTGFTNIQAGLPGVRFSSVAWGDHDNDGRLDFLLVGEATIAPMTQIWRNNMAVTNTPPTAPAGLAVTLGSNVTFSWNAASDVQTPASGLTYNLRVGTTTGGSDLVGPMAANSGFRRVPEMGNAQQKLSRTLTGLPLRQPIYWSVQAVDTGFAGSAFAAEKTFTMSIVHTPPNGIAVSGDVDGDGVVSQAEVDVVLSNYFPTSPFLQITNVAGLGGTNVTFALTNSFAGAFSVEYSTNMVGWQYLGPATPRYLFTDTNAPAVPQRYYRLRWP